VKIENNNGNVVITIARDGQMFKISPNEGKFIYEPNCLKNHIFADGLVGVMMRKPIVKLIRPIAIGVAVLELSKLTMYRFWYDYAKVKWGDKLQLILSGTDSFFMEIETDNFEADSLPDLTSEFDTSNYDKNSPVYSAANCKKVNMMKVEFPNKVVRSFSYLVESFSYISIINVNNNYL